MTGGAAPMTIEALRNTALASVAAQAFVPVAEAASATFRPSGLNHTPAFHTVRGSSADAGNAQAFLDFERALHGTPPAPRAHLIEDAHIFGSGFLMCTDRMIRETLYLGGNVERRVTEATAGDILPLDPDKVWIIAANGSSNNYWHWIVQTLPAILQSIDFLTGTDRVWDLARDVGLVLPRLNAVQARALEIMGFGGFDRAELTKLDTAHVRRAVYSTHLGGAAPFLPTGHRARVRHRFLEAAKDVRSPAGEQIYVARTDTRKRPVSNEADVIAALSQTGFDIVTAGDLDILEQVALFREARLIVAPHGAANTNNLFATPRTRALELAQASYVNPASASLMRISGGTVWLDVFADDGKGQLTDGWEVNMDVVTETLRRMTL